MSTHNTGYYSQNPGKINAVRVNPLHHGCAVPLASMPRFFLLASGKQVASVSAMEKKALEA